MLHNQSTSHVQGIPWAKFLVGGCSATSVDPVCAPAASLSTLATYLKASAPKAIASALEQDTFQSLLDLKRTLHLSNATIGYLQAFVMSSRNPTKVAILLSVGLVYRCPSTSMYTPFGMPCRKCLQYKELLKKLCFLGIGNKVGGWKLAGAQQV